MNTLYYGNGECSVTGECRAIEIQFRGAIEITDKTGANFIINLKNNKIIIYPMGTGLLTELFEYVGEFIVTSVKSVDNNADFVSVVVKQQNDFVEKITTNLDDMDLLTNNMVASNINESQIAKSVLQDSEKPNQIMANEYLNKPKETEGARVSAPQTLSGSSSSSGSSGSSY